MNYRNDQQRRSMAGKRTARLNAHVVEGENVTSREIASRLGISVKVALVRARRGPFPLTWEALQK